MLRNNEWSAKLRGIVVDEAHCVKKWYMYEIKIYSSILHYTHADLQGRYLPRHLIKDR